MSAASSLLTEDQFLCSICLDVFTDPVAIPCGHNFCKTCIAEYWNTNAKCQCPNCKKWFITMPELQITTFIAEMAALFRQTDQEKASSNRSEPQVPKLGEVPCDVCTGTKMKALKSCLVCLASYCETHLEPHLTASRLKRHELIDPVENLESRMCVKHDKILELFCRTDQMSVCILCTALDHKTHDVVALGEEYGEKKAELEKTDAEIQQMIQKRRLKIQELKRSVELSKEDADRETADGVQVFAALKESVERHEAEFINTIKEKHRQTERQAEDYMEELQQEISELQKRSSEVEQLSHSEDHLHLIQSFPSTCSVPPTKDWSKVSLHQPSYEGSVVRSVALLEETFGRQTNNLFKAELERMQQYVCDVSLDPDVLVPVHTSSPGRISLTLFGRCRCILSMPNIRSGKFYFEALVTKWPKWTFGVARKQRVFLKERKVKMSPANGFWTICRQDQGDCFASSDPPALLSLKSQLEKVGVFVDYEEGLISFFDVNSAALIYSFTGCCFTGDIYPFFSLCTNNRFESHYPYIR